MGTRHIIAVVADDEYKIAQYGQWDGYPSGAVTNASRVIKKMSTEDVLRGVIVEKKPWAAKMKTEDVWVREEGIDSLAAAIYHEYEIGIIDVPTVKWQDFDWGFFNQYGGIPVSDDGKDKFERSPSSLSCMTELRESPFYYWIGDKHPPVPNDVEFTAKLRCGDILVGTASEFDWEHNGSNGDIIAFRLTGKIVPNIEED